MRRDVMIDLETMATCPNAAVIAIAAVLFDPMDVSTPPEELGFFRYNVSLVSSQRHGLTIDASTVIFWMEQSREAWKIVSKDAEPLERVVGLFETWLYDNHVKPEEMRVWGHGATFDPIIWQNACDRCGVRGLWKYTNVRDTRTILEASGVDPKVDLPNLPYYSHDPLVDCRRQIMLVQMAYRKLGLSKPAGVTA